MRTGCGSWWCKLDLDFCDADRLAVADLPRVCDPAPRVAVPLFVFFDMVPLVEAGRLLDLLLLPIDRMPLMLDGLLKLAACRIRSWQKRSFSSLDIRSNFVLLVIVLEDMDTVAAWQARMYEEENIRNNKNKRSDAEIELK